MSNDNDTMVCLFDATVSPQPKPDEKICTFTKGHD